MINWIKNKARQAYDVVASQFAKASLACFALLGLAGSASAQDSELTTTLNGHKAEITTLATDVVTFGAWVVLAILGVCVVVALLSFVSKKIQRMAFSGRA